jgi:25S rRNA (uracil2843-N3)-methyltransferase
MAPPRAKHAANNKIRKIESKKGASPQPRRHRTPGTPSKTTEDISSIPQELQQLLLNIFKNSFTGRLDENFGPLLQEIKGYLYNRDFQTAFGKNEYLEVYAARWSPSRALGYLQVMDDLSEHILPSAVESMDEENLAQKIVCLGGGAGAEVVALGGFLDLLKRTVPYLSSLRFDVVTIDMANWSSIVETLRENLITEPPISKYASDAAKAANVPLLNAESINVSFHQADILHAPSAELDPYLQDARLITLMFTLNELYSTSLSLTQKFLLNLTACLEKGALLLVVDSPGSYSSVTLNNTEKKYPMQWLLDHVLLRGTDERGENPAWTKVKEDESRWFRLKEGMEYPIELENMRYQLHLYRRN